MADYKKDATIILNEYDHDISVISKKEIVQQFSILSTGYLNNFVVKRFLENEGLMDKYNEYTNEIASVLTTMKIEPLEKNVKSKIIH